MIKSVSYPNLRSRILMRRLARDQPFFDSPSPRWIGRFLSWYEDHVIKVDISRIEIDRPIFLIGLPRSGTTVLQDLICAHDRVAYLTNTMQLFPRWPCAIEDIRRRLRLDFKAERFLGDSLTVSGGSPSDATALWNILFRIDPASLAYRDIRDQDLNPEDVETIRTILRKIIWYFGVSGSRFFSKILGLYPHVLVVQDLFPDARFIHIIRDPRPTANSLLKLRRILRDYLQRRGFRMTVKGGSAPYPRFPGFARIAETYGLDDIRTMAHLWNEAAAFLRSIRPRLRALHEVRYEDLLARPAEEIDGILAFCELPPPRPDNSLFAEKRDGIGVIGHTNAYGEYDVVERICGPLLRDFGYLP